MQMKKQAMSLYVPPFRFEHGYIFDSQGNMLADDHTDGAIARIRGWGKIGYLPEAEEIQDTLGDIMAEALTDYWNKQND